MADEERIYFSWYNILYTPALAFNVSIQSSTICLNAEVIFLFAFDSGRFSALHHHRGHIAGGTADSSHTLAIEESGESIVIWAVQDNRSETFKVNHLS